MSPHSTSRKSGWRVISIMGFSQSGYRLQIFVWQRFSHNFIVSKQRGPELAYERVLESLNSKLFKIYSDRHWKSQLEVKMCSLFNQRGRERIKDQTKKRRKSSVLLILSKRKSALKWEQDKHHGNRRDNGHSINTLVTACGWKTQLCSP